MNKLLSTLIFAATATFALQGFAADAAPMEGAKQPAAASSTAGTKKKAQAHKKVHKSAASKADMSAK